jgi:Uma2 family endonuclease
MVATRQLTAEDVERMGSAGERHELIDGELRKKEPVSQRHAEIEIELILPLGSHVRANGLGRIYTPDTQFTVLHDPDKILIPDVAFVRAERIPPEEKRWHIAPHAPDLAVEVISPNDTFDEVMRKVDLYQQGGVLLVWLIHPRRRAVIVFPLDQPSYTLREGDVLDGGDVVPGFQLPVAELFK